MTAEQAARHPCTQAPSQLGSQSKQTARLKWCSSSFSLHMRRKCLPVCHSVGQVLPTHLHMPKKTQERKVTVKNKGKSRLHFCALLHFIFDCFGCRCSWHLHKRHLGSGERAKNIFEHLLCASINYEQKGPLRWLRRSKWVDEIWGWAVANFYFGVFFYFSDYSFRGGQRCFELCACCIWKRMQFLLFNFCALQHLHYFYLGLRNLNELRCWGNLREINVRLCEVMFVRISALAAEAMVEISRDF